MFSIGANVRGVGDEVPCRGAGCPRPPSPPRWRQRKRKRSGIVTQYQSKQEEKDGHHKTAIRTQWTYELKNYLRSRISQPRYSTGCRSNTSSAITVRSKPH